jgi:membrane-associated phospholipid phosphatase
VILLKVISDAVKNAKNRDIIMMLYWFPYLWVFKQLEFTTKNYHVIESYIDSLIPFVSVFVYPYIFWFPYMAICIGYAFIFDKSVYRHLMIFVIISYTIGLLSFELFPSIQNLRVDLTGVTSFSGGIVNYIYSIDTNTNVCPSIHVIGALGAMLIMLRTKLMKNNSTIKNINITVGILICLSTMFIKQHSFIDVVFGCVLTMLLYNFSKKLSVKLFE